MGVVSEKLPLDELLAAYESIALSQYRDLASGQRLVGIVGGAVPREVFHGFGLTPVHIAGLENTREIVLEFMGEEGPWNWESIGEGMLRGHYSEFAALILDRSHQHFYYYLKEMQRLRPGPSFPPVLLLDWLLSADKDHSRYNNEQARAFASRLERITGQPYAPELTARAVGEYNQMRATLRAFQALRPRADLSGSVAYKVMAVSHVMSPTRYRELLAAVMRAGLNGDVGALRALLVSSHSMMSQLLHDVVAAAGGNVVAEDDWWGSRSVHRDAPETGSIVDLCAFYASLGIGEFVAPMTKRTAWFRNAAALKGIDFAVLHHSTNDEHAGWDYPVIMEDLAKLGIPSVCVEADLETTAGREQATAVIGSDNK